MFTISNLISSLRLFLIPPLVISIINQNMRLALILIIIAYLSDIADGLLARLLNQESELGKVIDPLTDKLILIAVLLSLVIIDRFPFWALIILSVREAIVISAGIYLLSTRRRVIPASWFGKVAGWVIGAMVIIYIVNFKPLLRVSLYAAIALMALSLIKYSQDFTTTLRG
ncbi:hypothetical protein DRP53_03585 [candidate division WOR-3 bacterium]|uniref:CDP-alcohol phosphatidyltransferase family protein n=1 Tax=candidate division WOR-3 bacterium TaxID=2052148 RepID=A0A660SL58_UNCW3|nr:MAG: hypothetical protein DRP53_03585 [candidate division WOR-3 bacterium]